MREQWLAHSLETWGMVMERADGVPLFLENVFEPTPAQHVQVLRALGGRAGACLDIGHWHAFADGARKADLADWLSALGAFPMHLHLHDNDGSADQHLGLGEGRNTAAVRRAAGSVADTVYPFFRYQEY